MWAIDTSGSNLMNFHVVTHGHCQVSVEEQTFDLAQGDAIFLPTDAKHRVTGSLLHQVELNQAQSVPMNLDIQEQATGLVCGNFTHQHPIFDRLLAQLPDVIVIRHKTNEIASGIIGMMLEESKHAGQSSNFLLDRLADALFYILLRDNINTECGVLAAMSHPKLGKSFELIHNSFDQRINVDQLAESAAMSRSAFSLLFKKLVELSPAEYITQWRMTEAYRWLADESMSTYEAAVRCGYESEASFSKAFKRIIGVGPGQVRQMNKKLNSEQV